MMPIGPLMIEHRLIERMLTLMRKELNRIKDNTAIDPEFAFVDAAFIDAAVDFMKTYAHGVHHGKEEDILFAELAEKTLSPELQKVMTELKADHVYGRQTAAKLLKAKESYLLGGAANVAHNIVSLGGEAAVIGMSGDDPAGDALTGMLKRHGVDCSGVFVSNRPTTVKTRVIAHSQQVVRFDREDTKYVTGRILKGVTEYLESVYRGYNAIIVSDYRKGMISAELVRNITDRARNPG